MSVGFRFPQSELLYWEYVHIAIALIGALQNICRKMSGDLASVKPGKRNKGGGLQGYRGDYGLNSIGSFVVQLAAGQAFSHLRL